MKLLLAALLCLLTLASAHAQAWPRNPTTGKVEFKGTLPWPASAKTEAQRRALVRQWYLAKLTTLTREEVEAQAATNEINGLLTYAGLPKAAVLGYNSISSKYLLSYFAQLSSTTKGLVYTMSFFHFDKANDDEADGELKPLEQSLLKATPSEQDALVALRKRLAVALATW